MVDLVVTTEFLYHRWLANSRRPKHNHAQRLKTKNREINNPKRERQREREREREMKGKDPNIPRGGSNKNKTPIGLASDDVKKPSNSWQRGKLVLNKDCFPYKSMLGEKSLAGRRSLFFRREVWKVLTTLSQLSSSHIKRFRGSDKCGAVFRSIDDSQHAFAWGADFV